VIDDGEGAFECARGLGELFTVEGGLALGIQGAGSRWRHPPADGAEGGTNPWRRVIARLKQRIGRDNGLDDEVGFVRSPQSGQAQDAIHLEICAARSGLVRHRRDRRQRLFVLRRGI
jgi:hypothetical protein